MLVYLENTDFIVRVNIIRRSFIVFGMTYVLVYNMRASFSVTLMCFKMSEKIPTFASPKDPISFE